MKRSEKGLRLTFNRKGTKSDNSPPVARLMSRVKEPAICERCGSVFTNKTWRRNRQLTGDLLSRASWVICPACEQAAEGIYYGKVLVSGRGAVERRAAIERRIANVARLASARQPERKIVSQEWDGETLEVLTTSQKLAHRIATELEKTFGGKTSYKWNDDDGSLLARWRCPLESAKG